MASFYHCSVKPISRSAGKSCVAAAAYRIAGNLYDERTQTRHDYTRKSGVEASFIIAPANAPEWAHDPNKLWNATETAENRVNSQTAREVELALPAGVGKEERGQIARELAEHLVNRYGVAVMVALHEPSKHGDDRNYHAHVLMTTRRMDADGLGKKTRELDDRKTGSAEILHIREYAADRINAALEKAGNDERIDHRSYKDRGIEQTPTEHLGVEAAAMELRGENSRIGDENRAIEQSNQRKNALGQESEELDRQIEQAQAEILEFKPEAEAAPEPTKATYWQDKINAEREGENEGDSGGGFRPADPPSAEIEESPAVYSSITNHVTIAHAEQIAEYGEIQHKGLKLSWWEHALEYAHDFHDDIVQAWEIFKGGNPDISDGTEEYDREKEVWEQLRAEGRTPDTAEPKPNTWAQELDEGKAYHAELKPETKAALEPIPEPTAHKFAVLDRLRGENEARDTIEPTKPKPSFWQRLTGKSKTPGSPEPAELKPNMEAQSPEPAKNERDTNKPNAWQIKTSQGKAPDKPEPQEVGRSVGNKFQREVVAGVKAREKEGTPSSPEPQDAGRFTKAIKPDKELDNDNEIDR